MSQEELFDSEDVLERLDQLENTVKQLTQLGDFEKSIDKIDVRIVELFSEVKSLEEVTKEYSGELDHKVQDVFDKWDEFVKRADDVDGSNKLLGEKISGEGARISNLAEDVKSLEERADHNNTALEKHQESISFEKKQLANLKAELANLFDRKDQLDAYCDSVLGKVARKLVRRNKDEYAKFSKEAQEGWELSDDGESYFKYFEEKVPGTKSRLEQEIARHLEFRKGYTADYERMYSHIGKLAKGAVEVSLAKGYANAEKSHRISLGIWTGLLVSSLVGIVATQALPYHYALFPDWVQKGSYLVKMLFILPMVSPLIVLACIASKNSNIHRRFVEEYRYKKTLAATYNGLQEQFSQMKDNKLAANYTNQLLEQSLEASGHNPSSLMDNGKSDIPITRILDIFEKVGASTIKLPTWFRKEITFTPHMTDRQQSENVKKESE